jgi:hypothetical protein
MAPGSIPTSAEQPEPTVPSPERRPSSVPTVVPLIEELRVSATSFQLLLRDPHTEIGGRLRHAFSFWTRLTNDRSILRTVSGVKIPFVTLPYQLQPPAPYRFRQDEQPKVRQFILKLLQAQIIEEVVPSVEQFVSPIFLVQNHDQSSRLILNVQKLNQSFCAPRHFQMETLNVVLPLLTRGVWMTSLDLVQGYYNVPLHSTHRPFFCFDFDGIRYQFRALVMGLSDSPRIFTKLFRVLITVARRMGIQVVAYLDDTLLWAPSQEIGFQLTRMFASLLQQAGFLIHPDKSVFTPVQTLRFLGFLIDSQRMFLCLPADKTERLRKVIKKHLRYVNQGTTFSIKTAAQVLGFLISCLPASKYGRGHYRSLEYARDGALLAAYRDFDAPMHWPTDVIPDLIWWKKHACPVEKSFLAKEFSHRITTDASLEGWGAISAQESVHGVWNFTDSPHIDELELETVYQALINLPIDFTGAIISLRIDNQVAMAYVNNMGGKVPRLDVIARKIWQFLEARNAFVVASYVPSKDNPADDLTRLFRRGDVRTLELEGQLNPDLFQLVLQQSPFSPDIDWFASEANHHLPIFCSWTEAPSASFFDAFAHDWTDFVGFFFPPFSLLPRVLQKIQQDRTTAIVIHPWWPGATWFPLLSLLSCQSLQLPNRPDAIVYPNWPGLRHPMRNLSLGVTWIEPSSNS